MYYFMWRILTGLHDEITISFLPVGHTKFSSDCGFGLLKQKYKKTFVGCLDDIVKVVNQSAKPNWAQLVGAQDDSNTVPMYNWADYFDRDGPILLFTDISDTSICTEIICRYQCRYRYYTLKPRQVYYRNFIVVIHS